MHEEDKRVDQKEDRPHATLLPFIRYGQRTGEDSATPPATPLPQRRYRRRRLPPLPAAASRPRRRLCRSPHQPNVTMAVEEGKMRER